MKYRFFMGFLAFLAQNSLSASDAIRCEDIHELLYQCKNYPIDPITQQPVTCAPDNSVLVMCETVPFADCVGIDQYGVFNKTIQNGCYYDTKTSYSTALLLAIFMGFFGIDRIYLGYYAIGLAKMLTLGGMFVFWLVDVVLITLEWFQPADGTGMVMGTHGPHISMSR